MSYAFKVLLENIENAFQETLHAINKICLARTYLQSFAHRVLSPALPKHPEAVTSDENNERCCVPPSHQHRKVTDSR